MFQDFHLTVHYVTMMLNISFRMIFYHAMGALNEYCNHISGRQVNYNNHCKQSQLLVHHIHKRIHLNIAFSIKYWTERVCSFSSYFVCTEFCETKTLLIYSLETLTVFYSKVKQSAVDVQYLEKLYQLHNDFSFLPERIKLEKVEKLVINLHDKN